MKSQKYDYFVKVRELRPPLGENKFYALAEIYEIGKSNVEHGIGERWGKTKEEASSKMDEDIKQWIQLNNK